MPSESLITTLIGFTLGLASSYLSMWLTRFREQKESEYWLLMDIYLEVQFLADLHDAGIKSPEEFKEAMGGRSSTEVYVDLQRKMFRVRRKRSRRAVAQVIRLLHLYKNGGFGVAQAKGVLALLRDTINPKLFATLFEWDPRKLPDEAFELYGTNRADMIAEWDNKVAEQNMKGE